MKAIESLRNAIRAYDEFKCDHLDAPIVEIRKLNDDYEKIRESIVRWAVIYIHDLDREKGIRS